MTYSDDIDQGIKSPYLFFTGFLLLLLFRLYKIPSLNIPEVFLLSLIPFTHFFLKRKGFMVTLVSITFFLAGILRFEVDVTYGSFLVAFGIIFSDQKHWIRYLALPALLFVNIQLGLFWLSIFLIKQKKYRYLYGLLVGYLFLVVSYGLIKAIDIYAMFSSIINIFYKPMQLLFLLGVLCTYMKNDKRSEIGSLCMVALSVPFLSSFLSYHHLSVIYLSLITLALLKFCGRLKIHFSQALLFCLWIIFGGFY